MVTKFLLETLIKEGEKLGIPPEKKRALIREYLQCKILYYLYEQKESRFLSFIGGTSLRILRDLDRFSEDLDFDNLGLSFAKLKKLFSKCAAQLSRQGFKIESNFKKTNKSGTGFMKFIELLYHLEISSHIQEKLMIKLDYTVPKTKPATEILILNRFGLVQSIITNTPEFILSQKMRAILTRKDLQPRDFYDVVRLLSRNFKPDPKLFPEMKVKNERELFFKLSKRYGLIQPRLKSFKKKLAPFLINPKNTYYLDIFGDLMEQKAKKWTEKENKL